MEEGRTTAGRVRRCAPWSWRRIAKKRVNERAVQGKINVDIVTRWPDWSPFEPPKAPEGPPNDTINRVAIDVSGEPYVDLEREAVAMLSRE
jgi:hypothetical protein